jgi:NAD-dependent deacetylase
LKEIISLIKKGNIVAFCGAGLSVESGIPTFRGKGGLWDKYNPNIYATVEGITSLLLVCPKKIRNFIIDFYSVLLDTEPNDAHFSLKELEERGLLLGIITQNIDDLHCQAGSVEVAEIHGNAYEFLCSHCNFSIKKSKEEVREFVSRIKEVNSRKDILKEIFQFMGKCVKCGKRLQSGVVLFGQSLPSCAIEKSYRYLNEAEVVLCIGTSGVVYPAASLPLYAQKKGAKVISINPEISSLDRISDFVYHRQGGDFFRNLMLNL